MEKINQVARYGVDGYGRQDIHRDDENGEFVYYDDFKEMQQRAEAAEAECAKWKEEAIKAHEESEIILAKLAEFEKQQPDYIRYDCGSCGYDSFRVPHKNTCPECNHRPMAKTELFTRPAPAINLAELVPGEVTRGNEDVFDVGFANGFNACRAAMLRNIEGLK